MNSCLRRLCLGLGVVLSAQVALATVRPGVEIERVLPGGAAAVAGLEPGDLLLTWQRVEPGGPRSSGSFADWLDLREVEVLHVLHGAVAVRGRRGRADQEWTLPARNWRVDGRPLLDGDLATTIPRAVAALQGEQASAARDELRSLAAQPLEAAVRAYLYCRIGANQGTAKRWDEAAASYEKAAAAVSTPASAQLLELVAAAWRSRGEFDRALEALSRALAVREAQPEGELGVASVLNTMGNIELQREEMRAAGRRYDRSYEIRQRLAPGSYQVANSLNNLGTVAGIRNDLATAEEYFVAALEIDERNGFSDPTRFGNLGIVARLRGDLERAESYQLRALELERAAGPDSPDIAETLLNVGSVRSDRGDYAGAIAVFEEALQRFSAFSPDHPKISLALVNLGEARRRAGDTVAARADLERALALRRADAPGTLEEATALHSLGALELAAGNLDRARAALDGALAIRGELAPSSGILAGLLTDLARLEVAAGDRIRAERRYREAIAAIEAQQKRLGGGDRGLATFRSKFSDAYRELIDLLARANRPAEAFEILERSRAQALLALLGERDLDPVEVDASPTAAELRRLARELEGAFEDLSDLSTGARDAAARAELRTRIEALHSRRDELRTRVLVDVGRRGALDLPAPLALARLQAALDAGTVVFSYSLGTDGGWLFTLSRDRAPTAVRIDRSESDLRQTIEKFRELASRRIGSRARADLDALASELGRALTEPAAVELRTARRLLVLPDGPLHALPFAALRVRGDDGAPRWLIEVVPVHVAASLSVLAEAPETSARAGFAPSFVAFADPHPGSAAPQRLRSRLGPIPRTREEISTIATQYGDRARLFVDRQATEENARSAGPTADILHFAVHAIVDTEQPLDSALVLAAGESRGAPALLQAWEILESVRLDAELVTLSACQSGLGRVLAGEGVLGLTRAFHSAGARSVLVSLWAVDDEATSELMRRFYAGLGHGLSKDEALRAAQLELIGAPIRVAQGGRQAALDASSPFYWAPFVLSGKWQ